MRNKVVKKLLMIAMAVTMISGTSIATVYANANPPAEETTTQVVEETTTESTEDTEKKEDTGRVTGESNNSAFSTPGNAQLVDDKENDDTKQFLTIQTKKGNTFYMVIDRSSNTENVYMMSLVDENDLAEFLDETETDKETERINGSHSRNHTGDYTSSRGGNRSEERREKRNECERSCSYRSCSNLRLCRNRSL